MTYSSCFCIASSIRQQRSTLARHRRKITGDNWLLLTWPPAPYTWQVNILREIMKASIKKFKRIYHVGALSTQPAPRSRSSHEGPCLSVSKVPEAWRRIARLGNDPLWLLDKPDGQFLHIHKLTKAQKSEIIAWGYANGYATEGLGWVTELSSMDDNGDSETQFALDATEEDAIRMHGNVGEGEEGDDEVLKRYTRAMPFATEKLKEYAEQDVSLLMVFDMLALAYAEQVLDIDGLFWNERLDVYGYSAPRAGILRSKLSSWTINLAPAGHDTKEQMY